MSKKSADFFISSVTEDDYPALRALALDYPLLNLPSEPQLLRARIQASVQSFAGIMPRPQRGFLFVLKVRTGSAGKKLRLVGSSQILSKSGTREVPSYSLKICKPSEMWGKGIDSRFRGNDGISGNDGTKLRSKTKVASPFPPRVPRGFLRLRKITNGPSYLGGLLLQEAFRGHPAKAGKQISLVRFLFAARYPAHFEQVFHAEVAPFLDKEKKNPFFEKFIRPRTGLSLQEIDHLTLTDKEKLFSSYPREKILFSSLPQEVQHALGRSGDFSKKAAGLLSRQGFRFINEVDPFDGGPYMQAQALAVPLIQKTRVVSLAQGPLQGAGPPIKWLWGRMLHGRFTGGVIEGALQEKELFISESCFKKFGLSPGEQVFIAPFE